MNERGSGSGDWDDSSWGSGSTPPRGPYEGPDELQSPGENPWYQQHPSTGGEWRADSGPADQNHTQSLPTAGIYGAGAARHGRPGDAAADPGDAGLGAFPGAEQGEGYGPLNQNPIYDGAARRTSGPVWVIALLIVAILAVAGVGGYLVYAGRDKNNNAAPATSPSSSTVAASPTSSAAAGSTAAESAAAGSTNEKAPEPSQAPPTRRPTTASSAPTHNNGATLPAGLTTHGWTGNVMCNAADEWVYAGSNGSDYAVICTATPGGGLYYRGLFRGGVAEHDIAEYTLGSSPSFHTVPSGDTSIYINGNQLRVFGAGNAVLAETTFGTALVR